MEREREFWQEQWKKRCTRNHTPTISDRCKRGNQDWHRDRSTRTEENPKPKHNSSVWSGRRSPRTTNRDEEADMLSLTWSSVLENRQREADPPAKCHRFVTPQWRQLINTSHTPPCDASEQDGRFSQIRSTQKKKHTKKPKWTCRLFVSCFVLFSKKMGVNSLWSKLTWVTLLLEFITIHWKESVQNRITSFQKRGINIMKDSDEAKNRRNYYLIVGC